MRKLNKDFFFLRGVVKLRLKEQIFLTEAFGLVMSMERYNKYFLDQGGCYEIFISKGGILSAAVDDVIGSTFWESVKDFKEVLFQHVIF